jgi:hypothetical protein
MEIIPVSSKRKTNKLTQGNRVILEKLKGAQVVKKFPAFYGTRRFIIACTTACYFSLS